MRRVVVAMYKSWKYDIEEALKVSNVGYDELVYVFSNWIDLKWPEIVERAEEVVDEIGSADRLYIVGAGFIPCVLAVWDAVMKRKDRYGEIILLDYDTVRRRYRRRCIKGGDECE